MPPPQVNLPEDRDWCLGGGWWDVCGVPRDDVYEVVRQVAALYAMPRATFVDVRASAAAAQLPVPQQAAAPADSGGGLGVGSPDGGSERRQAASAEDTLQNDSGPSSLRANGVAGGSDAQSDGGGRKEGGRVPDVGDTGGSRSEVRIRQLLRTVAPLALDSLHDVLHSHAADAYDSLQMHMTCDVHCRDTIQGCR